MSKKKILFFAHAVTLAHFTRILKWIELIDLKKYKVYLASRADLKNLATDADITFIPINCISAELFATIVDKGNPIYDKQTFSDHVEEDIQVMEKIQPDLVIGDFRHSLTVSCRLKKIRYINMTNACWSPHIKLKSPMPEAPIIRLVGPRIYNIFLSPIIDIILKINFFKMAFIVRSSLKNTNFPIKDYREVITDGDLTLFCDTAEMIPLKKNQDSERYIGPVIWSMDLPLPQWWSTLDKSRKKIFISMGSSGQANLLPLIVMTLSVMDLDLIVATSAKKIKIPNQKNLYVTEFLPISSIIKEFSLVICNGGSPMTYASLKEGVPVIGIVCNNDQVLNMSHVERRKAGVLLRYWNLTDLSLLTAAKKLLNDPEYQNAAQTIQSEIGQYNLKDDLNRILEENSK